MSDWEASDSEAAPTAAASAPAPAARLITVKKKWEGEDEDDNENVASDWEESSDDEEEKKKAPVQATAPPKKRGTLKAKLTEKEKLKAEKAAADDSVYDSDEVLDPREKARLDKERELNSDLNNAADLLGAAALGGTSDKELDKIISTNPRTKEEFEELSSRIVEYIIKRHQTKPLYSLFVEHLSKELATPLKDIEIRKVASSLTTLANEKQREAKDKASGKKKKAAKPTLGSAKVSNRVDTTVYDEALDDFGTNADDFM